MVIPAGFAAAPLALNVPLTTLPGTQPVSFRSLLITGPGRVLTCVSLPAESNVMVEGTGAVTFGSLPVASGLRPSTRV
ncbi:hypothetical protein D3C78_1441510 [compost metagenome]